MRESIDKKYLPDRQRPRGQLLLREEYDTWGNLEYIVELRYYVGRLRGKTVHIAYEVVADSAEHARRIFDTVTSDRDFYRIKDAVESRPAA